MKKPRVALLGRGLNDGSWRRVIEVLRDLGISADPVESSAGISSKHSLAMLLGYHQILPIEALNLPKFGTVVFHSSNLPLGRGWAPIYYALAEEHQFLWQSLFYGTEEVDAGPLIAKARYPLDKMTIEAEARRIDDELTLILVETFIAKLTQSRVYAAPQRGVPTYYERRVPQQSVIDPQKSISSQWNHIRALPPEHPPHFFSNNVEISLKVQSHREFAYRKELVEIFAGRELESLEVR